MESCLSEYKASLADLTFNSKPHINMLTILAEENISYASDIVKIIEEQIFQVPSKRKMPVLYLLDSIVKNFGGQYMKLFSNRLIPVFMCIFEKADGKTRGDLYKLRSTWDAIFSMQILQELDLAVRGVDHNWPMRSKKHHRSRNPLKLGHHSSTSHEEDEVDGKYDGGTEEQDVVEVVEEEEIEMDDESLGVLEMLEEKLRKRQAELSRLEYLETKDSRSETPVFHPPEDKGAPDDISGDSDEDALKIDLNEYPIIPMEDVKDPPPPDDEETEKKNVEEEEELVRGSIDEDLSDTKHWLSHMSSFEPHNDQVKSHAFDGMTTNRVISHFQPPESTSEPEVEEKIEEELLPTPELPDDEVKETKELIITSDMLTQTDPVLTTEANTQSSVETKDETTQYRYRRKTKNFMSQYRVPTKTIGTFFKIKSKDVATQFEPPPTTEDTAADSTCLPLDDDVTSSQGGDSVKPTQSLHSMQILQSFRKQRRLGMLCDITLAAQGDHFKAHKAILASCSDFFYTLFASDAVKQTPLSYIELQGITSSALSLVLDYIYTSEVAVDGSPRSIHEIITAAKRLKIPSLSSVCPLLEEALEADRDLTGWIISNHKLLAPGSDSSQDTALGSSGSLLVQPSSEKKRFSDGEIHAAPINMRKSSHESIEMHEENSLTLDVEDDKKAVKRSLSERKDNEETRRKRRKDRSQSLADEQTDTKRLKVEETEKPYMCRFCPKSFRREKALKNHISKIHVESSDPESFNEDSRYSPEITKPVEEPIKKSPRGGFPCKECTDEFTSKKELNAHVRQRHRDPSRRRKPPKEKVEAVSTPKSQQNHSAKENIIKPIVKHDAPPLSLSDVKENNKTARKNNKQLSTENADRDDLSNIIKEKLQSGENPFLPSKNNSNATGPTDPTTVKLKLYQCEICEEIFSVQCFYKAHMAGHKKNGEINA